MRRAALLASVALCWPAIAHAQIGAPPGGGSGGTGSSGLVIGTTSGTARDAGAGISAENAAASAAAVAQTTANGKSSLVIGTASGTARDAAAGLAAEASASSSAAGAATAAAASAAMNGVNANAYLVCDGTTDNGPVHLPAWQAAIAASPGKIGYLPPQTAPCMTSANLQPVSGETIYVIPGTATLKPTLTSAASPLLLNVSGVSVVHIFGLVFDGNLAALTAGSSALTANVTQWYSSDHIVYDHVTIQNTRGLGLEASTSITASGVRDSIIQNVGMFWLTSGSNSDQAQALSFSNGSGNRDNYVTGSQFNLTGLDAISAVNQTSFSAKNNSFRQVGGRVANGGACVYASTDSDVHVAGNECDTPYGNGYDLIYVTGFAVGDNSANSAGGGGVQVSSSSNGIVVGNTILNSNQAGNAGTSNILDGAIVLGGPNSGLTISGNTGSDNQTTPTQQYGLEYNTGVATTCVNCTISLDNTFVGNVVSPLGGGAAYTSAAGTLSCPIGINPPLLSTTYTASGALSLSDMLSVVNCTGSCAMTLANGTTNNATIAIKQYGAGSVSVAAQIDGSSQTVTVPAVGSLKGSLILVWISALNSYVAEY